MRLSFGQEMRLVQKQVLAPRMIQSMEILQLPLMALQERIEQELQENPVLELKEDNAEETPGPESEEGQGDPESDPADGISNEKELVIEDDGGNEQDFDRLLAINDYWADHFNE